MSKQSLMDTLVMEPYCEGRTSCYLKHFPEIRIEGPKLEGFKPVSIQELQLIAEQLYDKLMKFKSRIDDVTPTSAQIAKMRTIGYES